MTDLEPFYSRLQLRIKGTGRFRCGEIAGDNEPLTKQFVVRSRATDREFGFCRN